MNSIQKFRPSTAAIIIVPESNKNAKKRVRPLTSSKYKKAFATLLAKTKCSSDYDFREFKNDVSTVHKNFIEEDDI